VQEVLVEGLDKEGLGYTGRTRGNRVGHFAARSGSSAKLVPVRIDRVSTAVLYGELVLQGVTTIAQSQVSKPRASSHRFFRDLSLTLSLSSSPQLCHVLFLATLLPGLFSRAIVAAGENATVLHTTTTGSRSAKASWC